MCGGNYVLKIEISFQIMSRSCKFLIRRDTHLYVMIFASNISKTADGAGVP